MNRDGLVDCDTAREALSARIDGEREPLPAARVDEHLGVCAACREWNAAAIAQTQLLRRLAGRAQVAAVRPPAPEPVRGWRRHRWAAVSWPRWALAVAGAAQVGVAVAQGLGAELGVPHGGGHPLNEATAWSAAVGVTMVAAALRPVLAGGLAGVLGVGAALLLGYEIADASAGRIGLDRPLSHLPVLAGAALALLVWRRHRRDDGPRPDLSADDIVLPENASRGRRRGHLRPSDGSAA